MGAGDLPADTTKAAKEVRQMKSPSEEKLNKILENINKNTAPAGGTLSDQGQIAKMTYPQGFSISTEKHSLPAAANFVEIHNDKQPDVKICTYYRGHRISAMAGKRFSELLQKPSHELSQADYLTLGEVVRDKAKPDDFEVTGKKTIDINGKRVLLVEGKYKALKQDTYSIFVDAANDGEVVQEIFYQAPEAQYQEHLKAAEASIKSITWK